MLKLVFNSDGSIKSFQLPKYVTQGSSGDIDSLRIGVAFADSDIRESGNTVIARFKLPNGDVTATNLTGDSGFRIYDESYGCKEGYIPTDALYYPGVLYLSIEVLSNAGSNILYTYHCRITVNPTTYQPESEDARINNAQYENLATQLENIQRGVVAIDTDDLVNYYTKTTTNNLLGGKANKNGPLPYFADIMDEYVLDFIDGYDIGFNANQPSFFTFNNNYLAQFVYVGNQIYQYTILNFNNFTYSHGTVGESSTVKFSDIVNGEFEIAEKGWVQNFVAEAISSVYKFMGSATVAELNALQVDASMNGNVYNLSDSGTLVVGSLSVEAGENVAIVWNSSTSSFSWDKLSGIFDVDLSDYYTKTETNSLLSGKADKSGKLPSLYVSSKQLDVIQFIEENDINGEEVVLRTNEFGTYYAYLYHSFDQFGFPRHFVTFQLLSLSSLGTIYSGMITLFGISVSLTFDEIINNTYKKQYQLQSNLTQTIDNTSTSAQYASAQAVYLKTKDCYINNANLIPATASTYNVGAVNNKFNHVYSNNFDTSNFSIHEGIQTNFVFTNKTTGQLMFILRGDSSIKAAYPGTNNNYDLGRSSYKWKNLHLSNLINPNSSGYGLSLPSTLGWTADKTLTTKDYVDDKIIDVKTYCDEKILEAQIDPSVNITYTVDDSSLDTQVPTAKAVYDAVEKKSNIKSWYLSTETTIATVKHNITNYGAKVYQLDINGEAIDITQDVSDGDFDDFTIANGDFASYTRNVYIEYDYDNHTILFLNKDDGYYEVDTAVFSNFYGSVGSTIRLSDTSNNYPDRWIEINGYGDITATALRANPGRVDAGNIYSSGATNGKVLTADGLGGASWEDAISPSIVGTKIYRHIFTISDSSFGGSTSYDVVILSTKSSRYDYIPSLAGLLYNNNVIAMEVDGKRIIATGEEEETASVTPPANNYYMSFTYISGTTVSKFRLKCGYGNQYGNNPVANYSNDPTLQ